MPIAIFIFGQTEERHKSIFSLKTYVATVSVVVLGVILSQSIYRVDITTINTNYESNNATKELASIFLGDELLLLSLPLKINFKVDYRKKSPVCDQFVISLSKIVNIVIRKSTKIHHSGPQTS